MFFYNRLIVVKVGLVWIIIKLAEMCFPLRFHSINIKANYQITILKLNLKLQVILASEPLY